MHLLSSVLGLLASGDSLSAGGVSTAFLFLRGIVSDLRDGCFSCKGHRRVGRRKINYTPVGRVLIA